MSLTHVQAQTLAFIQSYQEENGGVSPSFEEIAEELDISSKSRVFRILKALEERGRIRRGNHGCARAIEILDEGVESLRLYPTIDLARELVRRMELRDMHKAA